MYIYTYMCKYYIFYTDSCSGVRSIRSNFLEQA